MGRRSHKRAGGSGPLLPSQGLPDFRGDLPDWPYRQAFHSKALRGLQILTRYRWARFVATLGQDDGHGAIDDVIWIDAPGDDAGKTIATAREAFLLR